MSADASTAPPAGSTARVAVDVRRFPWVRPLAGDYAFNYDKVARLYAGDPRSEAAWRSSIDRVRAHPRRGHELAQCLAAQQMERDAPAECRAAAARLREPETVAVVTGQQAGAFGGPLFTLLKAVTAIQLARRTQATLGVPAIPVFWVDAEDHDWDEVAGCTLLDAGFEPRRVTLPAPEGAGEMPVAALRLDARVHATIEELEEALGRTDFTEWTLTALRASYHNGAGVAQAFATLLESLLGPHGLVVFDASDVRVKPLLSGLFSKELASPGHTAALAARAGEAMAALGHAPQVVPQPDTVSLFRLDGSRTPIRRTGDAYVAGERRFTAAALREEAAASPHRFSPNVLLRPVAQDTLFPTVCYVAGPSELAYLGQLREVYDHFGVPMPLIHPRATATVVDSATLRFLTRYDVPLENLQPQDESALNRLLQSQLPADVDAAIRDAEEAARRAMGHVIDVIPAVDPTLAGAARTTLGKIEHEIRALQGKVIGAAKKRHDTLRRQFMRAQAQTFPQGHPQERTLAALFFLNLYGPALAERLLQELPLDLGQHWVLTI